MKLLSQTGIKGDRSILVFSAFCCFIMILDSSIVSIYTTPIPEPNRWVNYFLFSVFLAFFLVSNFVLLGYSRRILQSVDPKSGVLLMLVYRLTLAVQVVLCLFLTIVAVQIGVLGNYELTIRNIPIYIAHLSGFGYLLLLVFLFIRWFRASRNYVILAYAIGFGVISLNILISLVYLIDFSSYQDPSPRLRSIRSQIADSSNYGSELLSGLVSSYTYLSLLSFVCIWIPSVLLLRAHPSRIKKIKYWVLVSIPLLYFFFPFLAQKIGLYHMLLMQYGTQFNLFYIIVLSPYNQIGGLLFGIVFWLTASRISRTSLRTLLQIAGTGMIVLFGSTVIHGLAFTVAPPFGLITISFVGLGSFLLLIGLYMSATQLSRDIAIRKEIYKATGEQFGLLKSIGIAEVNKNLERRVKQILQKTDAMAKEEGPYTEDDIDESEYKKFIEEALNEVRTAKNYEGK